MKKSKFKAILKAENKKVFNYLLKILRHREDAEDVLQETFIAFYHKMENVDAKSYRSYLFTTAYHKGLNVIKVRKKREKTAELDYVAEEIIEDNSSKNVHLYDLKLDPHEEQNIALSNKDIISKMEDLLQEINPSKDFTIKNSTKLSESEINNAKDILKKLGYV